LIPYQFTTYPIEHLYTHHKYVGSLRDPITAPKNMSLYYYYVRAIIASYKANFVYSKGIFALCVGSHLAYVWGLYQLAIREYQGDQERALGKVGFFIGFAYLSLFLMESIEYLEHYGLVYRK
jgi:alkane 1-monooxygenase